MSRSPIFVAIDTPDHGAALAMAKKVGRHAGGLKLGLEYFCANGPDGIAKIAKATRLPIFLDLKLHDIPNTVAKAIYSLRPLAPAILTVHAGGGRAMLEEAKAAAPAGTRVVAVTVLTSLDARDLERTGVRGGPDEQVLRLAKLAQDAGLDGIVCSGAEVGKAHKAWPDGYFVVPGIRPADAAVGDQKRVITPRRALDDGASVLVIGRPVTGAGDPDAALRAISATL